MEIVNIIKKSNRSLATFAVANGVLMPIEGLGLDSIRAMALSIENDIDEIVNNTNDFDDALFNGSTPSFIAQHKSGFFALIFLINQWSLRGNQSEEAENLSVAVSQSDKMLSAYDHVMKFKANIENVLEIMKYGEILSKLDAIRITS